MKILQLRYVLAIVDANLNMSMAADRLYKAQPGISRQIRLLEEELGVQVFVRKGKNLTAITPMGHQVISRARAIMREVERLRALTASSACHASTRTDGHGCACASREQARVAPAE